MSDFDLYDLAEAYEQLENFQDCEDNIINCQYCGNPAREVSGKIVYPHRKELQDLRFFYCDNNHPPAYVGTHKDSGLPFGTLANATLRTLRHQTHLAFDPLWKTKLFKSRANAYKQLRKHLGVSAQECHIGLFDEQQCQKVIEWAEAVNPPFAPLEEY